MINKTDKLLVIVESPTKALHIQEYLKKAGYNVRVSASAGHVMELADGGDYYNTGIDPTNDFKMDIRVNSEKRTIITNLKTQVAWADKVAIMTDPDREGFVIGWSLVKFLGIPASKYFRAVTHEITPKAVVSAIENPILMDDNLVEAGLARLAIDKIIGYRLSPIAKRYVGARSVGRCQSVGLRMVAEREVEIQTFKPETYYDLYLNFKKNNTEFKAKYIGSNEIGKIDHLKSQNEVDAVKALCTSEYQITGIERKEKQESPKPPFSTATFQQEAGSKLGLQIKDAMAVAQRLFEAGYVTYLRTDDDTMSPEFLPVIENYISSAYPTLKFNKPRVGKKTGNEQAGHECLRVTDPALSPDKFNDVNANTLDQKVYKMIWQRTIGSCLPNAVFSETNYAIDNSGQHFMLTSKELIKEGYKIVYSYKDDEDTDDTGVVKETFKIGEILEVINK